jgi:hypothetical protein|tara:strand:- start:36 stop:602 length:567 start_codon:yes stop_codon:yes gene_type:complete
MALFGGQRDISLFRTLNRELINEIIDTEVDIFKAAIHDTVGNLYGEALNKVYMQGVRVACLIDMGEEEWSSDEFGADVNHITEFKFLRDDLLPAGSIGSPSANVVLEVGDIIWWDATYWEIDEVHEHQYLFGKNPSTDKGFVDGERTDSLGGEFGSSFSIIVKTHETRKSKLKLEKIRSGVNNRISNL